MPDYSRRQMRAEYAEELTFFRTLLAAGFALTVILFWLLYGGKAQPQAQDALRFAALPVGTAALALGGYFVVSSNEWLLRRTPYGRAILALGDAGALLEQIDREALCGDFTGNTALLEHWLILYMPCPGRRRARLCARPVPAADIRAVRFSRDSEGSVWMTVETGANSARVRLSDQLEGRAVAQWMRVQEIVPTWME